MRSNKLSRMFLVLVAVVSMPTAVLNAAEGKIAGVVKADGSSTVFPITEAVAEEFQKVHPKVRVTVGVSGTGGGFKKFTVGETDISNASRPIKQTEREMAKSKGIEFIELPVAYDGIAVVVHPKNNFVDHLKVSELKMIWEPGSKVKYWSDVRSTWPKKEIKLYGPGTDSGTFDYFTEAVVGKERACRADFTASEDDNVLVQGVEGDLYSLGYFGFAYYEENKAQLKLVPVDNGKGPVLPSQKTIESAEYSPLARPIFIYVNKKSVARPEVDKFVQFYLEEAAKLVPQVGYVALRPSVYKAGVARFQTKMTGTVFGLHLDKPLEIEKKLALKGEQ